MFQSLEGDTISLKAEAECMSSNITISVGIDVDEAIHEMFDICESLNKIVNMVPSYSQYEAIREKDAIVEALIGWINSNAEQEKV
jgi:hypothetical protein